MRKSSNYSWGIFSKPCFRTEGTLDECHSTLTVKMMGFIMFRRPFSFSRWTDQFWIVTLITNARAVGNELGKSGDGIKLWTWWMIRWEVELIASQVSSPKEQLLVSQIACFIAPFAFAAIMLTFLSRRTCLLLPCGGILEDPSRGREPRWNSWKSTTSWPCRRSR